MSDSLPYQQCRQLKEEAQKYFDEQKYRKAAQLYKQAYELCPRDSYAISGYLRSLRKSSVAAAREAAKFARHIAPSFPDDIYVIREYVWAIYDGYLKGVGSDDRPEDEGIDDIEHSGSELPSHDFKMMVDAARRIFELTSDPLQCIRAAFAICKEAKRLKKWELVREFALRLDPQTLSKERKEIDGRQILSDYQQWLFAITRAYFEQGVHEPEAYNACLMYAHKAIEEFPDDSFHFQRWEALVKIRTGQIEEGLEQLNHINMRFPKQWYVQKDIADAYVTLGRLEDAWIWFCRAAIAPGDIKGRIMMLRSMINVLQRLEQWQDVYHHLLLAWAVETEQQSKQFADRSRQRIIEFRKRYTDHLSLAASDSIESAPTVSIALRPCRASWQKTLRAAQPLQTGRITTVIEEKGYGFITNDKGRFHFKFKAFRGKPELDAQVEFELEDAFDKVKGTKGVTAVNIRPIKNSV